MKSKTKIDDLKKHLAAADARHRADNDLHVLTAALPAQGAECCHALLDRYMASKNAATDAAAPLAKLPTARRELAASTAKAALEIGRRAALQGESYSGKTDYRATWSDSAFPSADTSTDKGAQYSRKCTYRKTDADHVVNLCPEWSPLLVEREELRTLSDRDGLPLIGIAEDGRCAWVTKKGKTITSEIGWIAYFGSVCYHSTISQSDADKGLARKLAAARREWSDEQIRQLDRVKSAKEERRARLVARLCGSIVATVADARALGFCPPGIEQFQAQHGIGSSAPLPSLIRTGNPSAIRLALAIARRVNRHPEAVAA
jgi:hypothetical protein